MGRDFKPPVEVNRFRVVVRRGFAGDSGGSASRARGGSSSCPVFIFVVVRRVPQAGKQAGLKRYLLLVLLL